MFPGLAVKSPDCRFESVTVPSFEAVVSDKRDYALATKIEYEEHDPIRGKAILQRHGDRTENRTSSMAATPPWASYIGWTSRA